MTLPQSMAMTKELPETRTLKQPGPLSPRFCLRVLLPRCRRPRTLFARNRVLNGLMRSMATRLPVTTAASRSLPPRPPHSGFAATSPEGRTWAHDVEGGWTRDGDRHLLAVECLPR